MKVEVLLYAYLAVCAAMICFNIVCIFIFRLNDKRLDFYSHRLIKIARKAIEEETVSESHQKYLSRKLRRISNLMAFDKMLDEMNAQNPAQTWDYLHRLSPVFVKLTLNYKKKGDIQAAYFPYLISKYKIFQGKPVDAVTDTLLELVHSSSLYVRENALMALYSIGDEASVFQALMILSKSDDYHHPKMITDGLLHYSGDQHRLGMLLWDHFNLFSEHMQGVIVDYYRFSSGEYKEQILQLLTSKRCNDEICYSCIRYFGKYPYEPAYPILMEYACNGDSDRWEYTAIAAASLAAYPKDQTVAVLKGLLTNANWHVRFNASQSLIAQNLYYTELIDVFEGGDRYASEIMRYRFDQKKMKEKEALHVY